jgi:hypothetical protein
MGEWRHISTILYLSPRLRLVVSFAPLRFYPRYTLGRRLSGPQSRSGHCGIQKSLFPLPGIEPGLPAPSLLVCWLSYPGSTTSTSSVFVRRWMNNWRWISQSNAMETFLIPFLHKRPTISWFITALMPWFVSICNVKRLWHFQSPYF